ncbi:hypothetical protein [Rheinheimera baltica]|uniref:hypothetical protein n=1 Tax=Rheinheimera baltica TaxID=67576 RepID=UPI00273FFDD1|nr:hypothetical protein [Rheinheimera baltica]MDP5190446.1 hypothetical protein [Rheinheimera baltica]
MITITESGMIFGPFAEDDCLELEKCPTYLRISGGVKVAEFAVIRQQSGMPVVWIVEAKSSSPRPTNQIEFTDFIFEIKQKLLNSILMLFAGKLDRHNDWIDNLPAAFNELTFSEGFKLVLVINGHQSDWLPPLQDALKVELMPVVKTLGLQADSVAVINDQMARRFRLIV